MESLFIKRLKGTMIVKNLTQIELSRITGIQASSINKYLHAKSTPNEKSIKRLAKALEVEADWLSEGITPYNRKNKKKKVKKVKTTLKKSKITVDEGMYYLLKEIKEDLNDIKKELKTQKKRKGLTKIFSK